MNTILFNQLWDENLPRIHAMIKRYGYHLEPEDAVQEAALILCKAIGDYDSNKGIPFNGYYFSKLRFHLMDKSRKVPQDLSLDSIIGDDENTFLDLLQADDDVESQALIEAHPIWQALKKLTPRQRQIITLVDINDISMVDVSKKLNIHYRTVVNTRKRAHEKLRQTLM
ncbi:MAG: sigma-70 family RNA polymerase sigma factor [Tissierellia bacterium]|nr:sigma-70 family RNA polymerase sigma factor [Tissierellia bacterium]